MSAIEQQDAEIEPECCAAGSLHLARLHYSRQTASGGLHRCGNTVAAGYHTHVNCVPYISDIFPCADLTWLNCIWFCFNHISNLILHNVPLNHVPLLTCDTLASHLLMPFIWFLSVVRLEGAFARRRCWRFGGSSASPSRWLSRGVLSGSAPTLKLR